jgi:hypothetical protein
MGSITIDGNQYPSERAFLVMSLDARRAVARKLQWEAVRAKKIVPAHPRVLAAACELKALGVPGASWISELVQMEKDGWPNLLDPKRIGVRLYYDRMHQGPTTRNVPGFRDPQLRLIDREMAAGSSPRDIACAVWRLDRTLARETMPAVALPEPPTLYLDRDMLPAGVSLSATVPDNRPYEPVIVCGLYAYAVSDAIMVLPHDDVKTVTNEVAAWMERNWPSAIEACDDQSDRLSGYELDRRNVVLVAEAFVRGFTLQETAEFIFDLRVRELEARVA